MGPGSSSLAFGSHENMTSMGDNQAASSHDLAQCTAELFVFLDASGVSRLGASSPQVRSRCSQCRGKQQVEAAGTGGGMAFPDWRDEVDTREPAVRRGSKTFPAVQLRDWYRVSEMQKSGFREGFLEEAMPKPSLK